MRIAIAGGTGVVGRHVVAAALRLGHQPVVLARSSGVDLVTGAGLVGALDGASAVIDVTGVATRSARVSSTFFDAVTKRLHEAEQGAGVGHHVALGIVGSARAPFGYYAGKALQERLVEAGPVPWTLLRATQFHEFAAQLLEQYTVGPFALVPTMRSQPVAAAEVGARLVDLAVGEPQGNAPDLAGPEALRMIDMVRRYAAAVGDPVRPVQIPLPGGFGRALRNGTLLPSGPHDTGTQTFTEWLAESAAR